MGLSAHIDVAAHEDIGGVLGMQGVDLRVRGLGEIKNVVALEGLVEEGQAQSQDDQRDKDKLAAQEIKIAGCAAWGAPDRPRALGGQSRIKRGTRERVRHKCASHRTCEPNLASDIQHHAEARFSAHHAIVTFGHASERVDLVHGANAV